MCFIYYDKYGITHAVEREEFAKEYSADGQYYLSTLESEHGYLKDYSKFVDIRTLSEYIIERRCEYDCSKLIDILNHSSLDVLMRFENLGFKDAVKLYFNPKRVLINKIMKQREEDIKKLTFY